MNFVMDALLKSLEDLVPYTCARVLIPEGGPHVLALGERNCPEPEKKSSKFPLAFKADESSFFHRILTEQKSILIADTKTEEKWQTFKGHKQLAFVAFSSLWLHRASTLDASPSAILSPIFYSQEHLRRAELLAIPAAAAIQNAKLYETARIYGEALESQLNSLKKAETALAQSEDSRRSTEEKFQKVFRSSPIPFSITTFKEGRFVDVNAAFERRYGYSRAEVLGHTVHELGIWDDPKDRELMLTQLSKGGPIRNVMTRLRMKSGEIKVTAYSADQIQFEGEPCILAVSEDLPEMNPHTSN